jgi:two-component system response regulator PilR (NtrC family)
LPGLVGSSLGMQRVAAEVRRHARTRAPILIQGESGTGKDVIARAAHQLSRRSGAYVPLNLSALPESLADAELFGHRRGAFTGAVQSRAGAFELAHAGTLFLDEIADLTPAIQVKLLRVVEDGGVRPLGATSAVHVDVRIVSASWAELEVRVAQNRFRADLFHRLSTVVVHVPPLRQRKTDIPELSRVLLSRMAADVGEKRLTSAALSRLLSHAWPGNVRELSSALYRAAMVSAGESIGAEDLTLASGPVLPRLARIGPGDARRLLDENQRNVSAAARAAGVPRSTFRSWLSRTEESKLADDGDAALTG